ncbi:MAG: hypothetical protein ACREQE_07785 [Candidatus Binataceae bacterium]
MVRFSGPRLFLAAAISVALMACAPAASQNGNSTHTVASAPGIASGGEAANPVRQQNTDIGEASVLKSGLTGVWEGVSVAQCLNGMPDPGRCNAWQNITLTMFQSGDKVTGYYKCAYGTQVCRNLDENGVIRNGTIKHGRLMMRVMLPDGSMCFFTGIPRHNHLSGGYSCLQGGGLLEEGHFRTQRSY